MSSNSRGENFQKWSFLSKFLIIFNKVNKVLSNWFHHYFFSDGKLNYSNMIKRDLLFICRIQVLRMLKHISWILQPSQFGMTSEARKSTFHRATQFSVCTPWTFVFQRKKYYKFWLERSMLLKPAVARPNTKMSIILRPRTRPSDPPISATSSLNV